MLFVNDPESEYALDNAFTLNSVKFDHAAWELHEDCYDDLARIVALMNRIEDLHMKVTAHTDNVGPVEYNEDLSQKRADAVKEYLIEKGVNVMAKDIRERLPLHYTFVKINKLYEIGGSGNLLDNTATRRRVFAMNLTHEAVVELSELP